MTWRSLQHVLGALEQQPTWHHRQQFQKILDCWPGIVGPAVAAQTRPISWQRQTLQVATVTSAWAQNLMFERQRLLDKLNQNLSFEIKEIRFSTAHWYTGGVETVASESQKIWQQHPSRMNVPVQPSAPFTPSDPTTAFQHWANRVRSRSRHLPLCPSCQCPTPEGELQRWSLCALCAAKAWTPQAHPAKSQELPHPKP